MPTSSIPSIARQRRRWCALGFAGLATLTLPLPLLAQSSNWPTRAVTIVSPYNPGGTNDVPARIYAQFFERYFGQPFVVKNVPGAAGILGTTEVMHAAPDGYTLLSTNSGAQIVQTVVKKPAPYHPLKDFTPIAKFADAVGFAGVSASVPVNTVGELIALAKREPGKLNYSSSGSGSYGNFIGEYFNLLAGTNIVHVPSKGSAAAIIEMKANRVQVMFDALVLPQSADGRIKTLAVLAPKRLDTHPDIPTLKESGGPDMQLEAWFGLVGPAGIPADIVAKLGEATLKASQDPEIRKKLLALALPPNAVASAEFRQRIEKEYEVLSRVAKEAHLVVQ